MRNDDPSVLKALTEDEEYERREMARFAPPEPDWVEFVSYSAMAEERCDRDYDRMEADGDSNEWIFD